MANAICFFIIFRLLFIASCTECTNSVQNIITGEVFGQQNDKTYNNVKPKRTNTIQTVPLFVVGKYLTTDNLIVDESTNSDTKLKGTNPYELQISNNNFSTVNISGINGLHDVPVIRIENNSHSSINIVIIIKNGTSEEEKKARNVFVKQVLEAHNHYRRQHGVCPLVYSAKISEISQQTADRLINTSNTYHRPIENYGENIFCNTINEDHKPTGNEPVDIWYSEGRKYFNRGCYNASVLETAHFTQIIWRNSTEIGIGVAILPTKYVVVCNYSPPGNVIGKFDSNVLPPL